MGATTYLLTNLRLGFGISELSALSIVRYSKEHDILEIGSVYILKAATA
jgi:cyanophycinase-like exopeptidase